MKQRPELRGQEMTFRMLTLSTLILVATGNWSLANADLNDLQARQRSLQNVLSKVTPSLVCVQDAFGAGSGVVVSEDGIVLTASHVVDNDGRAPTSLRVIFPDGQRYRAKLLGMNRTADAAMLKITEEPRNGKTFPFVPLGESSKLNQGEWCFAIGHPGGFKDDRPAPVRFGRVLSVGDRTVVSDCAIVLGDSGGPLFDMDGKVIGIHSMITEVIVENRHVAIDVFRRDGDRMEDGESWGRLEARDNDIEETSFFGVVLRWRNFTPEVAHVIAGSPAAKAGIRPGDILTAIDGQRFADSLGMTTLLNELSERQRVEVMVERIGDQKKLPLTIGIRPSRKELRGRRDRVTAIDDDHRRELKTQLTSLRHVGPFEKRSQEVMAEYQEVLNGQQGTVVEFRGFGPTLALGAVMSSDGYIMTKASELSGIIEPECVLYDGRRLTIEEVAVDRAYDLMLVKVDANNLTPVKWGSRTVDKGTLLITPDARSVPLRPGVLSVSERNLPNSKKGFLGVQMRTAGSGPVLIEKVVRGGAAERVRLRAGDVVHSIDGADVFGSDDMSRKIGAIPPNSKIQIRFERDKMIRTVEVALTPRFVAPRGEQMLERYSENDGKYASLHHSGFPKVLEHDSDLFPNQCGGPLYDLQGKAVGLNIARVARVSSYAIPAKDVLDVYRRMRREGK